GGGAAEGAGDAEAEGPAGARVEEEGGGGARGAEGASADGHLAVAEADGPPVGGRDAAEVVARAELEAQRRAAELLVDERRAAGLGGRAGAGVAAAHAEVAPEAGEPEGALGGERAESVAVAGGEGEVGG